MRSTSLAVILGATAAAVPLLVASIASAQASASAGASAGGSVSGSATVSIGAPPPPPAPPPTGAQPPPPPVVYQPGPQPQPYGYGAPPPPPPPPPPPAGDYLHDGFYLRFALGVGGFAASREFEPNFTSSKYKVSGGGAGMDFAIGGSPIPGLTIGGEYLFQQAVKPSQQLNDGPSVKMENNVSFGLIGPFIDWYPNPEGGFHFGGTLGLAFMAVTTPDGTSTKSNGSNDFIGGGGGALGVGYDFWVGRQLSLGVLGKVFGATLSNDHGSGVTEKTTVSGGTLLFSILYQ